MANLQSYSIDYMTYLCFSADPPLLFSCDGYVKVFSLYRKCQQILKQLLLIMSDLRLSNLCKIDS
jgi:hypothetical protein